VTFSYQTDSEMQRKKHRVCARVVAWLRRWPGDSSIDAPWGKISIPSGNLEDEKTRLSNNGLKSAPADANRVQQVWRRAWTNNLHQVLDHGLCLWLLIQSQRELVFIWNSTVRPLLGINAFLES